MAASVVRRFECRLLSCQCPVHTMYVPRVDDRPNRVTTDCDTESYSDFVWSSRPPGHAVEKKDGVTFKP